MIKIEDALEYLGIDPDDCEAQQLAQVKRAMSASEAWLKGAVGQDVDLDLPQAEELMLMAVGEFYETRQMTDDRLSRFAGVKAAASLKRMAYDLIMQLKYAEADD